MTLTLIAIYLLTYLFATHHIALLPVLLDVIVLALLGPSVESALGRVRLCGFCTAGGLLALATHALVDDGLPSPLLLIAAGMTAIVLGGYFPLHPRARVLTVVPVPLFTTLVEIPATVLLGVWLGLQIYFAAAGLSHPDDGSGAYTTYVGCFLLGLVMAGVYAKRRGTAPPPHPVY